MKPTLDWLSDPRIFEVNREKAHSDHSYFVNGKEPKQYLNGTWKFIYSERPADRPVDFFKVGFSTADFGEINVPGHIQLQGYGKPQYVNMQYPWEGHESLIPPQIPQKQNPVGSYVKYFDVDADLLSKEVYLSFQGVETAFYLWLNGEFVGYAEDSFTPSEFRITPYLKEKDNVLAVEVYRYSTASWLEDQDFWRFSGIFRDVYLYGIPKIHVRDMKVTADFDWEHQNGIFSVSLDVVGDDGLLRLTLADSRGNLVFESDGEVTNFVIPNIKPWSAEEPNLYTLVVEVTDRDGVMVETAKTKVGFRRFELKDGLMRLNGKRIVFKGIDRHEFDGARGRAVTEEDMLWDIRFLKQNNINAVRTSHYPNQSFWYRLCDEYGIYLMDETNLETHGTWQNMGNMSKNIIPGSLSEWRETVLDRAKSMYERDKNHACVLIWSCGNESHCGEDIAAMAEYFHQTDRTRLVHYEGVVWNRKYDSITDMESRMYLSPKKIEEYLKKNTGKPYISCEYMHAMGNSLGGLKQCVDLEERYEAYQGGFIWDYIDQALEKNGVLAYGGDFGDRPTDYGFCTNGIVYADRTPSPKVQEVKQLYSNIKMDMKGNVLTIKNENLFIDTSGYVFQVTLKKEEEVLDTRTYHLTVLAGEARSVTVDLTIPDRSGEYTLTASAVTAKDTIWAKKGHEISFAQEVFTVGEKKAPLAVGQADIVYGNFCVGVNGENFSMQFDQREGGVTSLVYDGREYITRVPKVSFFRAHTDNDIGAGYPFKNAQWEIAGKCAKLLGDQCTTKKESDHLALTFVYLSPSVPAFTYKVVYKAYFDGRLGIKVEYPGVEGLPNMPVLAMDFKMKKEYNQFTFYGLGPEENYWDRKEGARLGVYTSTAEENFTRYLNPQECGNRMGVRYVEVFSENGGGIRFQAAAEPFEMSVLPYNAYQLDGAAHREELAESENTWVRIAAKQMGVGGENSWGAPVYPEFQLSAKEEMSLEFEVCPLAKSRVSSGKKTKA